MSLNSMWDKLHSFFIGIEMHEMKVLGISVIERVKMMGR